MKKLFLFLALLTGVYAYCQKSKMDFVQFPDYPTYNNVITEYFKRYKSPQLDEPQVLCFNKKPDGWHVMIIEKWPEYKEIKDELFWTRSFNAYLDIGFEKLEDFVEKPIISRQFIDQDDSLYSGILPFWGYVGWEEDIINEFGSVPNLSDPLLYALARAYSSFATNLLNNNSGLSDPTKRYILPTGDNALSTEQLDLYREYEQRAIECYRKLKVQNPYYETFMGNVNVVYSNEIVNSYLTLSYYMNITEARKELKPKLYDPFIISVAKNYLADCDQNAILFTHGDIDLFPLLYVQETEGFRKDVTIVSIDLLASARYVNYLMKPSEKNVLFPLCVNPDIYLKSKKNIIYIVKRDTLHSYYDLKTCLGNVESTDLQKKFHGKLGYLDYFPGCDMKLTIDKQKVLNNNVLLKNDKDSIVPEMFWSLGTEKKSLLINEFIMLDMISCNDFVRPIYFTNTTPTNYCLGLEKYFQFEGFDYRLLPVENKNFGTCVSRINSEVAIQKLMHDDIFDKAQENYGFHFTNLHRNFIYNYRSQFIQLAEILIAENNKSDAKKVLDYCDFLFPSSLAKHNEFSINMIECYYLVGLPGKANAIAKEMFMSYSAEIENLLSTDHNKKDAANLQLGMNILYDLSRLTNTTYPQGKFGHGILEKYSEFYRTIKSQSQPEALR